MVGSLPSPIVGLIGPAYGTDGYRLAPENLYPTIPALFGPDDVLELMYGYLAELRSRSHMRGLGA